MIAYRLEELWLTFLWKYSLRLQYLCLWLMEDPYMLLGLANCFMRNFSVGEAQVNDSIRVAVKIDST